MYKHIFYGPELLYTCVVSSSTKIMQRGVKIKEFKGKHLNKFGLQNVKAIWFENMICNFIPRGIHDNFPNLIALGVLNSQLLGVSREDLEELDEKLIFIYFHSNPLTSLPDNLFVNMKRLREISIVNNINLMHMTSKLIENVIDNGLKYVDFSKNGCIDAYFCPQYTHSKASVEDLLKVIDEGNKSKVLKSQKKARHVNNCNFSLDEFEFPFAKMLLITQSPVFATMVEMDPEANEIELKGFKPESVAAFVDFLHTSNVEAIEEACEFDLFSLASQFKIKVLEDVSEENLARKVDLLNCAKIFNIGRRFGSEKVMRAAVDLLQTQFPNVVIRKFDEKAQELIQAVQAKYMLIKTKEDQAKEYDQKEKKIGEVLKKYGIQ